MALALDPRTAPAAGTTGAVDSAGGAGLSATPPTSANLAADPAVDPAADQDPPSPEGLKQMSTPLAESSLKSLEFLHRGKVRDLYAIDADRLLVVQAQLEGLRLLSADRHLAAYGDHVQVVN
jgi:hypothetical protein